MSSSPDDSPSVPASVKKRPRESLQHARRGFDRRRGDWCDASLAVRAERPARRFNAT